VYGGIIVLYKIKGAMSGSKKVEEEEPAHAPPAKQLTSSMGVPPIDSPEFDKFVGTKAFEQLLENEEQLTSLLEKA